MVTRNIAGLALLALLCTAFLAGFNFSPAQAAVDSKVFIRADGEVEGTTLISRSGDAYTFLGNVTGSLTVEKDAF
jgi:hypothetical protein